MNPMRKNPEVRFTETAERAAIRECLDIPKNKLNEHPRIKAFLERLNPGDRYSILDVDGTLFPEDSWGESPHFPGFFRNPEKYEQDRAMFRAGKIDATEILKRKYSNMQSIVTEELAATIGNTDIKAGMRLNDNVLFHLGCWKGKEIIKGGKHYTYALDAIEIIKRTGSETLFLSASPRPFVEGLISELIKSAEIDIKYNVIGTEIGLTDEGEIFNELNIWGEEKEEIAKSMEEKGVELVFGAGDSPIKVDRFLPYVKKPLIVDRSNGNESWRLAIEQLRPSILEQERVKQFLSQVKPGERYAILDVDGTIFRPSSWDQASTREGFILENTEKYRKDREKYKAGKDTVNGMRRKRNANIIKKVTLKLEKELQNPEIRAGMTFDENTLHEAGCFIGRYFKEMGKVYLDAIEKIREMESCGIKILFLSASPRQFIEGVTDELLKIKSSNVYVLGTELDINDGVTKERSWLYGSAKKDIALAMKECGARLMFGAGDSPDKNDKFLGYVEKSLVVSKTDGNNSWKNI